MKQIIVKNMTLLDYSLNTFYKIRFWVYRNFNKSKLINISESKKDKKELVFNDDFKYKSWGNNEEGKKWTVGGNSPYHPGDISQYYGPAKITKIDDKLYGECFIKYNPKTFKDGQYPNNTGKDITIPFEVTRLSTINSFRQNYGRFECRCSIPHEKGVWPAFWMWGSTWPPEIDVFELYGGKKGKTSGIQKINLHYGVVKEGTKDDLGAWGVKVERKKPKKIIFHEFACEWSKDKIEIFTDGVKIFRYTRKDILNKWYNVNNAEMWIVLNHAIQKDIINKNDKEFKSSFYVDYIRAYKNK